MPAKRRITPKRCKSITGADRAPRGIKPQKARALIRGFHVLQKHRTSIFKKLSEQFGESVTEENYLKCLKTSPNVDRSLTKVYARSIELYQPTDEVMIVDNKLDARALVVLLGNIDAEIAKKGGIGAYQTASTQGQNGKRGGDSSKKLMEWIGKKQQPVKPTALEIGCLSSQNVISTCNFFSNVVRIDLRSQEPGILEQDFMKRPLPKSDKEKVNLISCSLVLNFVPSPKDRGEMLKRFTKFLLPPMEGLLSALFMVLPLPCVANSRYCNQETFKEILGSLGFSVKEYHEATKVAYWLFEWNGETRFRKKFSKKEIHSGGKRNNFCIVLE
ncbi:hypothetical protein BABINDRAFT_47110 [Babjeviella inositovora NRRL Y-12698]|uniref:25S rRNA adenine-N(1) methyltransferase n=1 Tax=Babjeviella inositovora NRRL Y-12698 TaxID=984486 RepID=A0A1E3QUL2_9ASCO|nr:uncharacterized protein BABINDRAFT_47110 [Babjeviella inositovora NRRL Y-12698]ODQ81254.1 hypothetical protein BABINDRAFT_47110 [Babjeviella inositovora NRRL Y-12698]